jgi:hypothetical protein
MARTIEAPGVEIKEIDLSLVASNPVGTKVLLHGFAKQGPTNELIQVSTKEELDQIFFGGADAGPTNAAERYFYHSASEILNSPATLYVTRLPYGSGGGTGFDGEYTALCYPISGDTNLFTTATALEVLAPTIVPLTESDYENLVNNEITWSTSTYATTANAITGINAIGNAGMVIVNKTKTTIDEKQQGYYVVIADNTTMKDNYLSGYNSVQSVKSFLGATNGATYTTTALSSSVLGFSLTGDNTSTGTISEIVETAFNYDFTDPSFNDSIIVYLFRLRTSEYSDDKNKLYFTPVERYAGALESADVRVDGLTKTSQSFYIANKINNESAYISMFVNTNIANLATVESITNNTANQVLNPLGKYKTCKTTSNTSEYVGTIPDKIERALVLAESLLDLDIDIVLDGGLSTIWTYAAASSNGTGNANFDDTADSSVIMDALRASDGDQSTYAGYHKTIFNLYNNFCQNTRKDCVHISDPIRGIFVQGENSKTLASKSKNFSQHVYAPLKNLYNSSNSNYSAAYANWIQIYDNTAKKFVWMPFSGWQAAIMARLDSLLYPWSAPMGLNNGIIRNITDIAVRPNQKQQDQIYKIGINPVVFFTGDGFVVWGQKTLQKKPSAFDRINVRRLFLTLERSTLKTLRYFVAEPNTIFTRTRVVNTLKPLFELAKNNEGVYDFLIICSEKNNDAQTIDNNEMKVDIYLKPVRTAEFIICTFYATRTNANFAELAG